MFAPQFIAALVLHFLIGFHKPLPAVPSTGSIKGIITFTGALSKPETYKCTVSEDVCGGSVPLDRLVVGKNRGVRYSLIFVKNPPPSTTANMSAAVLTQKQCRYLPHMVIAARGSKGTIINDDEVLHNSHGYYYIGSERTTAFNIAQPVKGQQTVIDLKKQGMVNLECDAGHVWMSAWIWVTANPFAVVTNENGEYILDGLPPGTYTLVMWHEGWKTKGTENGRPVFSDPVSQEMEVTVAAGAATSVNFELR